MLINYIDLIIFADLNDKLEMDAIDFVYQSNFNGLNEVVFNFDFRQRALELNCEQIKLFYC